MIFMVKTLQIRLFSEFVILDFFLQYINDHPVNSLPDIRREPHWFKSSFSISIPEVISFNLLVQDKDGLREQIFTKSLAIDRESLLVDSENKKTHMPKNKFFRFLFRTLLGLGYESSFFSKRSPRILFNN